MTKFKKKKKTRKKMLNRDIRGRQCGMQTSGNERKIKIKFQLKQKEIVKNKNSKKYDMTKEKIKILRRKNVKLISFNINKAY